MAAFLKGLILLPVAILVVLLAVANRDSVRVSLDPFTAGEPLLSFSLPLYALLFATAALGVLIGGCASWLAQTRVRRERREARREAQALRGEAERLRAAAGGRTATDGRIPTGGRAAASGRAASGGLPALPRPSRA